MRTRVVGWCISAVTPKLASLRYRVAIPASGLDHKGIRSLLIPGSEPAPLPPVDALVVVKTFSIHALLHVHAAARRGMPVILDLCDNIFYEDYGKTVGPRPHIMFQAMAMHATAIVVTTEALADVVRAHIPGAAIHVIPDGCENEATILKTENLVAHLAEPSLTKRTLKYVQHPTLFDGVSKVSLVKNLARRLSAKLSPRRIPIPETPVDMSDLDSHKRYIVWFGTHGAPYGQFGMLDLLSIRTALETVAKEQNCELVVISNNREKFDAHIAPMRIATRYVEWTPYVVRPWLQRANAVVIPNSLDSFSICKSANRTILALQAGAPVVATYTPALEPFRNCVWLDDFEGGLRAYLQDPDLARRHAREGQLIIARDFSTNAIASAWSDLLDSAPQEHGETMSTEAPTLLFAMNLPQDLDLLLPVMQACREQGVRPVAWVSASLVQKSPRVLATLMEQGIEFTPVDDRPDSPPLPDFPNHTIAVLNAAETNLNPHRFTRQVANIANERGILSATMQHGVDNIGLTYTDEKQRIDAISIASRKVYIWGGIDTLHPSIPADTAAKCIPIGHPKPEKPQIVRIPQLEDHKHIVGIFENLHWHRFNDDYRANFLTALQGTVNAFPHVTFLVKPHHAGVWLTSRYDGPLPSAPNLIVADPRHRDWEPYTATALFSYLQGVITTPSTVALDAARADVPVAIVADDEARMRYAPLTMLESSGDWGQFIGELQRSESGQAFRNLSRQFVARTIVGSDAASRIVSDLTSITGHQIPVSP